MILSESGSRSVMSPIWTRIGLAARPWPARVDEPGCAGDRLPCLIVAVEVADGNDPLRQLRM